MSGKNHQSKTPNHQKKDKYSLDLGKIDSVMMRIKGRSNNNFYNEISCFFLSILSISA